MRGGGIRIEEFREPIRIGGILLLSEFFLFFARARPSRWKRKDLSTCRQIGFLPTTEICYKLISFGPCTVCKSRSRRNTTPRRIHANRNYYDIRWEYCDVHDFIASTTHHERWDNVFLNKTHFASTASSRCFSSSRLPRRNEDRPFGCDCWSTVFVVSNGFSPLNAFQWLR